MLVLAAGAGVAEQLWRPTAGPGGGPEPGHTSPQARDLAIGHSAEKAAVAQLLDPATERAVATLRAAMECDMNPKKVVAGEHVAEQ